MGKYYQKIKRGMMFWFNLDENVSKNNDPRVEVNGRFFKDSRQYGYRNWLVVSNDVCNSESSICNIVPVTTSEEKSRIPTHVCFNCRGKSLTILCEQITTVNQAQLNDYDYTLSDELMERVDDALRIQIGVRDKKCDYFDGVEASMDKIEKIIEGIIKQKVQEHTCKARGVDIEDAVLRLGEGLESLFSANSEDTEIKDEKPVESPITDNSSSDEVKDVKEVVKRKQYTPKEKYPKNAGQVDKFYTRYPNLDKREKNEPIKSNKNIDRSKKNIQRKKRTKWTKDTMEEFIKDLEIMHPEKSVEKWGFKSITDMNKAKYYVKNKLDGLIK